MAKNKHKKKKCYGARRIWLNTDKEQLACVAWDVSSTKYGKGKPSISSDFTIRDCSRVVTLEFYCDAGEYAERLKKADKLLKEVTLFRDALSKAIEDSE